MIETLYQGKFVKLSKSGTWEYAERVNSTGAGFILAVTPDKELVLVEQYRVPMQARTIELPAGIIGDEGNDGEAVEASAIRELEEETGFRAARAEILFSGPVAPGLASEMLYLVRTYDLVRVGAGGGVDNENITVHIVPLTQIDDWLAAKGREGLLIEPRIYAALYFLLREKS
ncbi:NUDIX hydrolase [Stenotrophobium rhamnosiphilum]|uniref:DNA mismatch repair protein MutT n=1 Tax=Stenotrophobium rhamnosiphilum TaxID=2029166 RepID=A0A2T5MGM0_9GAMM|nr:NUDIX hydrolase [Stenotrophobium rhamnosiphilum]PTU31726.1 DNA mismatch repair protein MutT [Stenotrophobium rhamnosiphilum]